MLFAAPAPAVSATRNANITAPAADRRAAAHAPAVQGDANVVCESAPGFSITAHAPAVAAEVSHRLVIVRPRIVKFELEAVGGHWRLRKAA